MFGMSFVYIIFEDDVDVYWARTRVLERLNYAQRLLPEGITPTLGPDGTGVGHVWYTLDAKGMDLGDYHPPTALAIFRKISTRLRLYFPALYWSVQVSFGLRKAGLSKSNVPCSFIFFTIQRK